MSKIINKYAPLVGITSVVAVGNEANPTSGTTRTSMWTNPITKVITVNAFGGKISPMLSNIENLKSTLYHEKRHVDNGLSQNFKEHALIYLDQIIYSNFNNCSMEAKANTAIGFAQRMINHLVEYQKNNHPNYATDKQFLIDKVTMINGLNLGITMKVVFPNTNASLINVEIVYGDKVKEVYIVTYSETLIDYGG